MGHDFKAGAIILKVLQWLHKHLPKDYTLKSIVDKIKGEWMMTTDDFFKVKAKEVNIETKAALEWIDKKLRFSK